MRVTQQQQAARSGSSCVASRTQAPAAALRARRANGFTACATRRNMYQDLAYTPTTESFDGGLDFEYDTALPGTGFLVAPPGGYPQQGGYQQQGGYPMQGGYQNNRGAGYPSNLGGYRQAPRFQQQQQQLQPVQPMQDFWQDDEEDLDDYAGDLAPPEDKSVQQRTVNGKQLLINQEIKAAQVRVIGGEGGKTQRGIMSFRDAMMLANDMQVDLVLLNDQVDPPLCRLVSWSKYKYEIEKDQKKKASKSSNVETKEVRLRPGTDSNDLTTKLKSATKFLEKGNKVQLVMKFQGRELQFKEQGKQVMLKFVDDLNGCGKVDGPINFKTGTFTAMLSPIARGAAGAAVKAPAPEPTKPAAAAATQLPLPPSLPPTPPVLGNGSLPLPPPLPPVTAPAAAPAAPAPAVPPAAPPAAPGRVAPPAGVPTPAPLPMPPARPAAPAPAGLPLSPTIPAPGPRPMAPPPLQRPGLAPPPMMVPQRPVGAPAPALTRPGPAPGPQRPAQQPLQQPQRMPMPATAH